MQPRYNAAWALSQYKDGLYGYDDSNYNDRLWWDNIILLMGIPLLAKSYICMIWSPIKKKQS